MLFLLWTLKLMWRMPIWIFRLAWPKEEVIFIVTAGETLDMLANPGLSEKGKDRTRALARGKKFPKKISKVKCGTGARHTDTADTLGLTNYELEESVGGPEQYSVVQRKSGWLMLRWMRLANGKRFGGRAGRLFSDKRGIEINKLVHTLPARSLVVGDRSTLYLLGYRKRADLLYSSGLYVLVRRRAFGGLWVPSRIRPIARVE